MKKTEPETYRILQWNGQWWAIIGFGMSYYQAHKYAEIHPNVQVVRERQR